jgi:ActR/RegA family two-component response regulator
MVVLDVYMPGYSGLEVCARIKEGRDTEGIPVLLTVGKLEPFRQEDARKVHADAFIIKPFEATELLSALGKLESKAGNHSQQSSTEAEKAPSETKSSKHVAATMARYEREVADGAPKFGDHESGWKARLTMPAPGAKHEEPEPEPQIAVTSTRPAGWDREPSDRPAFSVTPPSADATSSLSGLPTDVTPDELAAIAAAAAAVGGKNGDAEVEHAPASTAEASEAQSSAPATFASEPGPQVETPYPINRSSTGPVSAEVEAVFTSFAAAQAADGSETSSVVPATSRETLAGASASNMVPMPARWVAEEVPVEASESALVLEREMQKAFAAFAAAENSAAYEPGPVDKTDEPIFARSAPPAIGAPTPFTSSPSTGAEIAAVIESQPASAAPNTPGDKSAPAEIAKPPAVPFTPVTVEEPKHAVVAFGEPHPFGATPSEAEAGRIEPEEDSSSRREPSTTPAASVSDDWHDLRQPVASAAPSNGDGKAELENFSSEKTGKVDKELESAAMAAAASGDSGSSSADNALSSIVDNMLAELKPKLMAELAKKLDKK